MTKLELKEAVINHLHGLVDKAIESANEAIESAMEARNGDTKSSAGDKYETGREMMQIEIDKNTAQLHKARLLKQELSHIQPRGKTVSALSGSLVVTNQGYYFLSIGHGRVTINGECVYAISVDSPIGKLLHNKPVGGTFEFLSKEYIVEDIV